MNAKERWRKILVRRVSELTENKKQRHSRRIRRRLEAVVRAAKPARIFGFAPTAAEPDLRPLYRSLLRRGVRLAFPKVRGRRLIFFAVRSLRTLRRGAYGILEPATGRAVRPRSRDLIFVPCVGLADCGHRLGHGGGYYDRWLGRPKCKRGRMTPLALAVGVLFHCQIVGRLPHTAHDAAVDAAVTELQTKYFGNPPSGNPPSGFPPFQGGKS